VNRFLKSKNLAFTLAEMMVILALFSTIAAATLPVITARNALDNSNSVTNGSTVDPWYANTSYNGIGYYDAYSALANMKAVMVGGEITEDAYSIGYPQLTIKDTYGANGSRRGTGILLLKNQNGTAYKAGKIAFANNGIAIGANAMDNGDYVNVFHSRSIAIGSNAMANPTTNSKDYNTSVAIGAKAMYGYVGGNGTTTSGYSNVALGTETCANQAYSTVCIGNKAGKDIFVWDSVVIGTNATYGSGGGTAYRAVNIGSKTGGDGDMYGTVNIGHYAAFLNGARHSNNSVSIGSYAGAAIFSSLQMNGHRYSYHNVSIGNYAGYAVQASNIDGNVYLGSFAGYNSISSNYANNNLNGTKPLPSIMIGSYAGAHSNTNNSWNEHFGVASPIVIGNYAGFGNFKYNSSDLASPVIIGTYAMYNQNSLSFSNFPNVAIGYYAGYQVSGNNLARSIFIGNNTGAFAGTTTDTICIGSSTCSYSNGNYDVRISPYGYYNDSTYGHSLRRYTSFIGYLSSLGNGSVTSAINNSPGTSLSTMKSNLLSNSSNESNMYISPIPSWSGDYNNSSIILYAEDVYGPDYYFNILSDRRLKENIRPSKYGLKDIRKVNVYEYNWKNIDIPERQIGVIAQEMQKIFPEGVYKNEKGILAVNSDWLIYPMVNAIQELDKSVTNIKNKLAKYVKEYSALVSRVRTLENKVKKLEKENRYLTKEVNIAYKKAKSAERR